MQQTDLSKFDNRWYNPGAGGLKRLLWYLTSIVFINSHALLPYSTKCAILRLFGAKIGKGVVIKPKVNIKYPWKLEVGDYAWIGEGVWIDNLDIVSIGANACISQGALVLSGNHDYSKSTFDLLLKPISIGCGAWIGAKTIVTQGVIVGDHAVLTVGSVASTDLEPMSIYRGNPAQKVKERRIEG
ncbi:MAG: WcaF family extracellular polysaccharide biosynthesis acetyltransferase [Flavobacteriales bacterium]